MASEVLLICRYPNGYTVSIEPSAAAKWVKLRRNVVAVYPINKSNQNIIVAIRPK